MNVGALKKTEARVDTTYLQRLNIQGFGKDNLYPQTIASIVAASGTASLCLARYIKFIEGNGFLDMNYSEILINRQNETVDDLLHSVAEDLARFHGFAIHCNYNVLGEITELHHVPFEQCRLEEEDGNGYVAHIILHPDWRGKRTRNGRRIDVNRTNCKYIDVFNPNKDVVFAQIEASGGIENYMGQILWVSMDGKYRYPTPIYDGAITDISTDEGLGNVKYRNVRNNFLVSCMLIARKGVPQVDKDGNDITPQMISDESLLQFQGDTKSSKILYLELENTDDKPEIVEFPSKNYDKDFNITDESVIERIYSQFHQELFYAIRIGKLGFSGQVMTEAYEYYAGEVTNEQRFIERAFDLLFAHWFEPVATSTIQPLRYITTTTQAQQ